jgi:hypothetical protein
MREVRTSDPAVFPEFGARARAWARLERELRAWMESPEGRFAEWRAVSGSRDDPLRGGGTPAASPSRPDGPS